MNPDNQSCYFMCSRNSEGICQQNNSMAKDYCQLADELSNVNWRVHLLKWCASTTVWRKIYILLCLQLLNILPWLVPGVISQSLREWYSCGTSICLFNSLMHVFLFSPLWESRDSNHLWRWSNHPIYIYWMKCLTEWKKYDLKIKIWSSIYLINMPFYSSQALLHTLMSIAWCPSPYFFFAYFVCRIMLLYIYLLLLITNYVLVHCCKTDCFQFFMKGG